MARVKQEDLSNFLYCASVLEERAYMVYKKLAEIVTLPLVNSMLLHIAYDSQKHSAIIRGVSESIAKTRNKSKACRKEHFLDDAWSTIDSLVREYAKNDERTQEEKLLSLLKTLDFLESSLGEEYYMLVQMKTLQYMTKQIRENYDVDLEDLKSTFEGIIQDEEKHAELLSKIKKILAPKENKAKDNTPEVRYTNPDAWTRPMPDSVYENAR